MWRKVWIAINIGVRRGSSGEHRCSTRSRTWFVEGIYHTNSPEVISIFTRQSALHTSHLENSWLLPIIHKWRLTFRLGRGHIHYVQKYHLLMRRFFFFFSSSCSAYAYGTAEPGPFANEWPPHWHDVYCTSIWYWCILRCKQGFKLYAPPCQWLRVTLAICLSAGDERRRRRRRRRGWPGCLVPLACVYFLCVCVIVCTPACMYLLKPHVWFLPLLVLVSSRFGTANRCSWVPSPRRDSLVMINVVKCLVLHQMWGKPADQQAELGVVLYTTVHTLYNRLL